MKAQHYKLKLTPVHIQSAKPGQLVFANDESNTASGFVDFVSDDEIAIMLFEPAELPKDGICIQEECDYILRLQEIFKEYPDAASVWREYQLRNRHTT